MSQFTLLVLAQHCCLCFRPVTVAAAVTSKVRSSLTGLNPAAPPPCPKQQPHIWKKCTVCQWGSPGRYEYRSISYPIWGPWSHVSTCIALLATSPGHIGDRKEVAEQKHSRCSSSVGHRGSLLLQHLAHSAQSSEAERWCSATVWLSDWKSHRSRIVPDPLFSWTVPCKLLYQNFSNNLLYY